MTDGADERDPNRAQSRSGIPEAVALALVSASVLGIAEWLPVMLFGPNRELHGPMPWSLVAASLGERVVTHAIWLTPLLLLVAVSRMTWSRWTRTPPVSLLTAVAVFAVVGVTGLVTIPIGVEALGMASRSITWGVRGVTLVVATGGAWLTLRARPIPPRVVRAAGAAALMLGLFVGFHFAQSPWADPGRYRVPRLDERASEPRNERPNVLLVVLDTVRPDHMSVYGHDRNTTPFLDAWSRQALVFDFAIADGTWTVPSHASLFTGQPMRRHGAGVDDLHLDGSLATLAESLAGEGYSTASFSNNSLISSRTGLDRGFASSQAISPLRAWSRFSVEKLAESLGLPPLLPWLEPDDGAAVTNRLIASWLDARERVDAPIFVFVNYLEAHIPWRAPQLHRRAYMNDEELARSYALREHAIGNLTTALNKLSIEQGAGALSPADTIVFRKQYDAAIRYLDLRVEELLGIFSDRGLLENALVVITSDHGEHLGTQNMWSHLIGAHNELSHVALMVREPGRRVGARIGTPVQLSDVHATVLAYALERPTRSTAFASRDLLALATKGETDRIVISEAGPFGAAGPVEALRSSAAPAIAPIAAPTLTAQNGRFKYVEREGGPPRLYDVSADADESFDVSRYRPEVVRELADHLDRWRSAVPEHSPRPDDEERALPTPLLRELGYVE